jgi:hypothetical protein
MQDHFVFIYAKRGEIKALNLNESKKLHDGLMADGWKHTATLDPCIFIQYLHNDCKDLEREINELSIETQ